MAESTMGLMGRLKSATADLHRMAEGRALQRQLVGGTLPRELYVAFLSQMYLVHRALEEAIRQAEPRHRAFGAVVRDYHWRAEILRDDLAFFAFEVETAEPLPATNALIREVERTSAVKPIALLGMLYVLEGSTNGSKFIAAALTRKQGLEPGPGLAYLDPHGDIQKDRWLAFKRDMDAVGFSEAESAVIIEAAEAMFRGVADISDELMEPVGV